MKNYALMAKIGNLLRSAGLEAVAPDPDEPGENRTAETSKQRKCNASRRHMDHIRHRSTAAILVVNPDRPGAKDYVGPNAFAEISVAFLDRRRVFLLNGMPTAYAEELGAWGVRCLNWDIRPLLEELSAPRQISPSDWAAIQYAHA